MKGLIAGLPNSLLLTLNDSGWFTIQTGIISVLFMVVIIVLYATNRRLFASKNILIAQVDRLSTEIVDLKAKLTTNTHETEQLKEIIKFQKEELSQRGNKIEENQKQVNNEVLKRTSELHTMLEIAEESNKLKTAFLEKISRELRTPLNAILGFINLLNNPDLPDRDRAYYYKYIHDSGNNLLSLIDNIIDFSKLETHELLIEPRRCNITIMLTDLVEKYRNRLVRQNQSVNLIFTKPESDHESLVDCKRVIHIVDQLLNNAIKFTLEGKIELNYQVKDDRHVFQVSDSGIGIDKKYQEIIFERFYQIEPETREAFQGAGLGLTIARGLVELLGGVIALQSEPGKGSVFTFTIPFIGLDHPDAQPHEVSREYNWESKKILIAEDEDSNFHFLEAILKKTKAKIIRAVDGVKFLEIINEIKDIDLVLLDIKMPGINGFNAIKVVRQQKITIPVIAQTAFNQPEDKQMCLDSGCNDYLSKPIDKDLLLTKIARFF